MVNEKFANERNEIQGINDKTKKDIEKVEALIKDKELKSEK